MTEDEKIRSFQHTKNWFNFAWFYDWVVSTYPEFKIFVEVGCWKGHSVSYLANLLRDRQGVEIHAVDLWEAVWGLMDPVKQERDREEIPLLHKIYEANLRDTNTRHLIRDHKVRSDLGAQFFSPRSVDFVYIDADHGYHAAKRDVEAWAPIVKPGGLLAGHDYVAVRPALEHALGLRFLEVRNQNDVWWLNVQ